MDSQQHEALVRMFYARRLDPNEPEHALFIEAELRKLEVLEPADGKSYRAFYDSKIIKQIEEVAPEITSTIEFVPEVKEVVKKAKKVSKKSSPK